MIRLTTRTNCNSISKMNLPLFQSNEIIINIHNQIEKDHQIDGIQKNSGTKSEILYSFNSILLYGAFIFLPVILIFKFYPIY